MQGLNDDTRALIAQAFDSVESIELLLLLRRSSNTFWSAHAAAEMIGVRDEIAERKIAALAAARLLRPAETTGAYRYAPATEELARRVEVLVEAYATRRAEVINTIYSGNLERLRAFSNAFKLKGE